MNDTTQKLASTTDLAQILGVTRSTVIRWTDAGRIPAPVMFGRVRRWVVADVIEALREQSRDAQPA